MSELERGGLWLDQAVGHHVEGNLTADEAALLTAKIKSYVGVTWVLIAEAHARRAHKALGYPTWADYVEAEFDISRSRSYQLISQARVVLEISEAVSTDVDISEAMARDLHPVLDEAKAAAVDAAEALPEGATDEDKSAAVTEALDRLRASAVEATRPKATQTHTVTESTTTIFDPETGEIVSGDAGDREAPGADGARGVQDAPSGVATSLDTSSSEGGSLVPPVDAPDGSPSVPPIDPTLGYRARSSAERSKVRSGLFTLDPDRVIETSDDPDSWRTFAADLADFSSRLDRALAGPRLKAVR